MGTLVDLSERDFELPFGYEKTILLCAKLSQLTFRDSLHLFPVIKKCSEKKNLKMLAFIFPKISCIYVQQ